MTLELLAVPEPLVGISSLRLSPAKCIGGFRPDAFEPVPDSELEHVRGPECETCGGSGYDPECLEGCCPEHDGPVITIGIGPAS